jgi:hypothetical protein
MKRNVVWNLLVPLTEAQLVIPGEEPTLVQFGAGPMPTDSDHAVLGEWLAAHPDVEVRFSATNMAADLEFLRHYSRAHRVLIELTRITSFDGLAHLREDLSYLGLGSTKAKRVSLAPLRRFRSLQSLWIESHTTDLDAVASLTSLRRLSLRSLTLPSLDMFKPLTSLRSFELKLGGTRNLDALPDIGALEYLEIWRVLRLDNLDVIGRISSLQYLFLQHLRRVTALPGLSALGRLRRLYLDGLKGLTDLQPIAAAPRLEELFLLDMPQLTESQFNPLVGHPTLKAVSAGRAKRQIIEKLLGLPDVATNDFVYQAD